MTEPTNEQKARYIVEKTGGHWHKEVGNDDTGMPYCACGFKGHITAAEVRNHIERSNPTFLDAQGKIDLLEIMEAYPLFYAQLMHGPDEMVEAMDDNGYIDRDYLRDKTGKLFDAAYKFFQDGENERKMTTHGIELAEYVAQRVIDFMKDCEK
jgi:hypothetical protein